MNTLKKPSIGLIIALVGFPQISETIYTPALPKVASSLLASANLVEATLAIYFIGFALGVLLWGTISDRCGRRASMLVGLIIYGISTFFCGNASSIESLLGWRLIQAFGASVGSVITQTILRDIYTGEERTKLFSILSGALAFSPALGPLLGGTISEFIDWRANFWFLLVLDIVIFIWAYTRLSETRPAYIEKISANKIGELFLEMFRSRALIGHTLLIGATNGILFGFYQEAPFVFIEQLKIQPSYYGLFGMLIALATLLAARISYRKSSTLSSEAIIQSGSNTVLTSAGLFVLSVLTGTFFLPGVGIVLTTILLFSIFFGIGLIIPNSLSHALKPYQKAVGTAGSLFGGAYYCLIAFFTWAMSVIHTGTALSLPLYIAFLGGILVLGSYLIQVPKEQKTFG